MKKFTSSNDLKNQYLIINLTNQISRSTMILVCDSDQNDSRFDIAVAAELMLEQAIDQPMTSQLIYPTHLDQATLLGMKGNNQFQFFASQKWQVENLCKLDTA